MPVIIRCTDGHAPQSVLDYCDKNLIDLNIAKQIVTVRRPPEQQRGLLIYYQQLLTGLNETKAKYVFIVEHDILYHQSHFGFIPPSLDTFYYQLNVWRLDKKGFFRFGKYLISQLVCGRELLIKILNQRINAMRKGWKPKAAEFGVGEDEGEWKIGNYATAIPSVDIRHGQNYTAGQHGSYVDGIAYWGGAAELLKKLDFEKW